MGLSHTGNTSPHHLQSLNIQFCYCHGFFSIFSYFTQTKLGSNLLTEDQDDININLRACPISATELRKKQVEKLSRVGVLTLEDFTMLPMSEIARRFDIELVNYIGKLTGQFKHPVDFYHPPEEFHHYLELLFDIDNRQWLEKPLRKLLIKSTSLHYVAKSLMNLNYNCTSVTPRQKSLL